MNNDRQHHVERDGELFHFPVMYTAFSLVASSVSHLSNLDKFDGNFMN